MWRRIARRVDRFCCWALFLTGVGGSALLDLHDLIGR